MSNYIPHTTPFDILGAWEPYVVDKIAKGWKADLLTFLFVPLPGSSTTKQTLMTGYIQQAYAHFVTRVIRKPKARSQQGRLPIWLCWPDLPVFKHIKTTSPLDRINEGLHYHALGLNPPWSRLDDVGRHFFEEEEHYRQRCCLEAVDVEPIVTSVGKAMAYSRKSIVRDRFPVGDELVLPRSLSELEHSQ